MQRFSHDWLRLEIRRHRNAVRRRRMLEAAVAKKNAGSNASDGIRLQ